MFEWDENKRLSNIDKHGFDFVDAVQAFDGRPNFTYVSRRGNEERYATVSEISDRFWVVVWIPRGSNRRIISAHRASNGEIRKYRELHC